MINDWKEWQGSGTGVVHGLLAYVYMISYLPFRQEEGFVHAPSRYVQECKVTRLYHRMM